MFAHDVHLLLALAALAAMLVVTGESAVRTIRGREPRKVASAASNALLVLLLTTAAGGLAVLVGGHRPDEYLHLMYTLVAFGLIPLADSLSARATPRGQACARLLGSVIALVAVVRLFQTG
jgi:hypothetical protein